MLLSINQGQGQNNKGFSLSFVPLSHLILTTRSLHTVLEGSGQHVPPRRNAQKGSRLDVFYWRFMFFHVEFYFLCFLACHGRPRQSILSATADRLELIMGGKEKEGTFHEYILQTGRLSVWAFAGVLGKRSERTWGHVSNRACQP